jgi:hypothetical protein
MGNELTFVELLSRALDYGLNAIEPERPYGTHHYFNLILEIHVHAHGSELIVKIRQPREGFGLPKFFTEVRVYVRNVNVGLTSR